MIQSHMTSLSPDPPGLDPFLVDTGSGGLCRLNDDLAQPLRANSGGDVHRVHNIREQHRHLLALRRSGGLRDWRAALAAELGVQLFTIVPARLEPLISSGR